ncbi:ABC transporter ATP-binding protein [Candidatus Woesebacteria bacterium]|nr:ABC transporter ATP-binding protein [Candidatus Woesebacteria bacterium]
MSTTSGILLQTTDLKKSFHVGDVDIEVLKGINISMNHGEFVIIFGPSGCGKSTLLHCLLGLEAPSSGTVHMDNEDFYSMTEDNRALFRRHKVGMIYQQPLWVGSFNVIENVKFPLYLLNLEEEEIHRRAIEALTKVGLEKWAEYAPTELSSGQQQKISLARSLMIDPVVIVADEPTGNLDTISGQELLDTFLKLISEGKSIVMVTHDLEYLHFATKIFHMIDGQVVEEYRPKNKSKFQAFGSKKSIDGKQANANVHDPELLKKLQI